MPRIRTIKPETPQSESFGRLSRDARLLFLLLFTVVDDVGRTRGSSRMLASLLYPYDDDAPKLIEGWLAELEGEGCIRRYEVEGQRYLDLPNWLKHQKVDKPTPSRLPEYREASRGLANSREASTTDMDLGSVSRTKSSEANASASAEPPPEEFIEDDRAKLFGPCRQWLQGKTGKTEPACRALMGRWLKTAKDDAAVVLGAIRRARDADAAEVVSFIEGILRAPAEPVWQPRKKGEVNEFGEPIDWHYRAAAFAKVGKWFDYWGDRSEIPAEFRAAFEEPART